MTFYDLVLIMLLLLPYGYVLAGVLSTAYFQAKIEYHRKLMQHLDTIATQTED